jgi:hypothetical protein
MTSDLRADPTSPERSLSPPAVRSRRSRWRDPRLWAGVVLVAGSTVVGARVLAAADNTVAVWAAAHDLPAGSRVTAADLEPAFVHFDNGSEGDHYLLATGELPNAVQLGTDVAAGELLARSLLDQPSASLPQLPIGVPADDVPSDLHAGERVAVWAVPEDGDARGRVTVVFTDVLVVDISGRAAAGSSGDRQVLLEVASVDEVDAALRLLAGHRAILVRVSA